MDITEVRIKPHEKRFPKDRLQAFCSVTFDNSFVVHDVKIIGENSKGFFLAMPQRSHNSHCPRCQKKNCSEALYCNWCGKEFNQTNNESKVLISRVDVAHPVTNAFRRQLEEAILTAFKNFQRQ